MLKVLFKRVFRFGLPILLYLCYCCFFTFSCQAAQFFSSSKKNVPIVINSDRLEIDDELKRITFTGNVVATQGELKIMCKKMVVYYISSSNSKKTDATSNSISKIVCSGDVKIYRGKQGGIATSSKAVYYQDQDKLILTGKPVVKQGKSFVEGDRIIIFLKQNRSIVESSKNRPVKAVIFPKSKKE